MSELPDLMTVEMSDDETSDSDCVSTVKLNVVRQWESGQHPLLLKQLAAKRSREGEAADIHPAVVSADIASLWKRRSAQAAAQHVIRSALAGLLHKKAALVQGAMLATRSTQGLLGKAEQPVPSQLGSTTCALVRRAAVKAETFRAVRAACAGVAEKQTKMIQSAALEAAIGHIDGWL